MTTLLRWVQLNPAHLPASRAPVSAISTDPIRNKVFAFQGSTCASPNNQSDAWNGTDWTNLGNVPSSTSEVNAAAWDVANSNTVLFNALTSLSGFCMGQFYQCFTNSIYTYDGTTFTLHTPVHMPSPRVGGVMAYSPALGKVVYFGGFNTGDPLGCSGCAQPQSTPGFNMFPETWLWDGSDFTHLVTATSPPSLDVVTTMGSNIYGWGWPADGSFPTEKSKTLWKFDGTNWSIVATAHNPPSRSAPTFAYWPSLGKIVMHGGSQANGTAPILDDTWSFDGTDWTEELPCGGGPARTFAGATYDPVNGWYLMQGGNSTATCSFTDASQTWKLEQFTAADATTGAASANVCANATLNGTVNPHSVLAAVYFDYGLTTAYGSTAFAGNFSGGSTAVSVALSSLTPGQTYHFRVRVVQDGCTINGLDASFLQGACASGKPTLNSYFDLSPS